MNDLQIKFLSIHDDVRLIMDSDKGLDPVLIDLNKYMLKYKNETCRGTLMTLLTLSKPFRKNVIIKEIYIHFCNELKKTN